MHINHFVKLGLSVMPLAVKSLFVEIFLPINIYFAISIGTHRGFLTLQPGLRQAVLSNRFYAIKISHAPLPPFLIPLPSFRSTSRALSNVHNLVGLVKFIQALFTRNKWCEDCVLLDTFYTIILAQSDRVIKN